MSITLVQKNKSKGIMTWSARVPDPHKKGVVHYFSLGTSSKSEAKLLMQQRIKEGAYEIKEESETMTLGEAAVKFEQYERAKGAKPGSIVTINNGIRTLENLFDKPIVDITTKDIHETFMTNTAGNSSITYRNKKVLVTTFFNYIVDVLEIIPRNPIKKAIPKRKVKKAHREFWTQDQVDRIVANAPNPSTRLLWSLMAFAGLRVSEAKAMRPEKIYDGKIHVVGKGDKPATIPVCPRLQREIERYKGEWKFKFSQYMLEKIAKKAIPEGFPGKAHAHRFRHSFGSNILRANKGINLMVIRDLMRHENITLTIDTYGHLLDSDTEKAISEVYK